MEPAPSDITTGYLLHAVYASEITYSIVDGSAQEASSDDEAALNVRWDWRVLEGSSFEVLLAVHVHPTKAQPHRVSVVLVGSFEAKGVHSTVGFKDFVRRNAVAILFPYVRETISSVTRRGPLGAVDLPPLNMVALTDGYSFDETTGAGQLRDQPNARALLGLTDEVNG